MRRRWIGLLGGVTLASLLLLWLIARRPRDEGPASSDRSPASTGAPGAPRETPGGAGGGDDSAAAPPAAPPPRPPLPPGHGEDLPPPPVPGPGEAPPQPARRPERRELTPEERRAKKLAAIQLIDETIARLERELATAEQGDPERARELRVRLDRLKALRARRAAELDEP